MATAGGMVAVSRVPAALTITFVAALVPNWTNVGPAKPWVNPVPLMVMVPPPAPTPSAGESDVVVGTGSDSSVWITVRLSGMEVVAGTPDESLACTVKWKVPSASGVPEMTPVWGSRLSPLGSWPWLTTKV